MKKLKYLLFISLMNLCCKSIEDKYLFGNYLQDNDKNTVMIFTKNDFVIKERQKQLHMPVFSCCDTITYGVWSFLNKPKLIKIDNQSSLNSLVNLQVVEKNSSTKDSIYIYINNPIEDYYKKYRIDLRDICYYIELDSGDSRFDLSVAHIYENNFIKLSNPNKYKIKSIQVFIYPKNNFVGRNIGERLFMTPIYNIKNIESNAIDINIPNLTYQYMTYIRLKEDFIRVIDRRHLEWNGDTYTKK